jgi:hypothetical protein
MFRIVHCGNSLPASFPVDSSVSFQAGQLAEFTTIGNMVMVTVSSGLAPLGIIDDMRTKAFSGVAWNETVLIPVTGVPGPGGKIVSPTAITYLLKNSNIIESSFLSTVNCTLIPINGAIVFPAGTELNIDLTGGGTPNGIKAIVNYTYFIANVPGDDSTLGSGRVTVWYQRMIFQTDQFETNQQYPVRANLYCSESGLFTTRKPSDYHPAIGMVTAPPSPMVSTLEVYWY